MGNELQMARTEDDKPEATSSELLDEGRDGVSSNTSSRRNKRTPSTKSNRKAKRTSAKDSKAKGSPRAKAENSDGDTARKSRRKGHRRHDKDWESDSGAEGDDKTDRRSASELGVEWIGSYCPDGQPHQLYGRRILPGWCAYRCGNCKKQILLPVDMREAKEFDGLVDRYGAEKAYLKFLDKHREAKVMTAKLQDLWKARQVITDDEEFVRMIVTIMEDREYDRVS